MVQFGMSEKPDHVSFDFPRQGEMLVEKPAREAAAQLTEEEVRCPWAPPVSRPRPRRSPTGCREQVEEAGKRLLEKGRHGELLGRRPFVEKPAYKEFVKGTSSLEEDTSLPEGLTAWNQGREEGLQSAACESPA
ncbi:mitochondrial inner membrane m-AAA protease component AFG3L1-like isoform X2 [Panthera onca]|uniref:AFG3-like protein 1 n=1 Tax=Panthera onca TaxID=9690 RepID=UPI002952D572|nr:AFG3-like protein 1 [Panthera onca]